MGRPTDVYILRLASGGLYIGMTGDLPTRIYDHERGRGCASTRRDLPRGIAYVERYPTRELAHQREQQLKRWGRRKKLALIAGVLGPTPDALLAARGANAIRALLQGSLAP